MKSKFGIFLIVLGTALIVGALSLFCFNEREASEAAEASAQILDKVMEQIEVRQEQHEQSNDVSLQLPNTPLELLTEEDKKMTEVEIDGYSYIGYIIIPSLSIELPVMSDWSYSKLKIAPCRHTGTVLGEDLVICAHNYTGHFNTLSDISLNDDVIFIDMDGVTTLYRVVAKDILPDTAVEEMLNGEYDLTLYTCTYGSKERVTVRCDIVRD